MEEEQLKPIIKWAGGKRSIMNNLLSYFPKDFNNYHEPFFGGGSVMIELMNRGILKDKNVYISDAMETLINMYKTIQNVSGDLIQELKTNGYTNERETFLTKRERFNVIKQDIENNKIECAALFLYLNRTCFNGMYRENSSGGYNVPFGRQKNPLICNEGLINKLSNLLNNDRIKITQCDYTETLLLMNAGDFVYMDPPYYGTFTDYNKVPFGDAAQVKLRNNFRLLTERGCKVAISNSNHPYIRELYKDVPNVKMIEIPVKRMINSKGNARSEVKCELLIINY